MKVYLCFFNLLILSILLVGSKPPLVLSFGDNTYLSGDSIYKYQVEYMDPDSISKDKSWDYSRLKTIFKDYKIEYFHIDTVDTTDICGMENNTRFYYKQDRDSIWALGFENYTTKMDYTKPELKMKFPFILGDSLYSEFEGKGIYCNMLTLETKGSTKIKADLAGTLKLPGLILDDVLRVHAKRLYSEIGNDSLSIMLDTYSWYTKNIRYPIFESVKTTVRTTRKDTSVYSMSYFYSPEKLINSSHTENVDSIGINGNTISGDSLIIKELTINPNPVITEATLRFNLSKNTKIWFSLHNTFGFTLYHTKEKIVEMGWNSESIKMNTQPSGAYVLYAHVEDRIFKYVIIKK